MEPLSVELNVVTPSAGRGPVTAGIPFPKGALPDAQKLSLRDASGAPVRLQSRATDLWPDGSVRWVLLDWIAEAGKGPYRATVGAPVAAEGPTVKVEERGEAAAVDTGAARFEFGFDGNVLPLSAVTVGGVEAPVRSAFQAPGWIPAALRPPVSFGGHEPGDVRACLRLLSRLPRGGLEYDVRLHFFSDSATIRIELTVRNSMRAVHPDGLWDLGDRGSLHFKDVSLRFELPASSQRRSRCSPELSAIAEEFATPFELYQDSSGGENWRSTNHMNGNREVPTAFRGYRLRSGGGTGTPHPPLAKPSGDLSPQSRGEVEATPVPPATRDAQHSPRPVLRGEVGGASPPGEGSSPRTERTGLRATPLVTLGEGANAVGVAVPQFWQNFPMAVEATNDTLTLRLLPQQFGDVHELQGGEQKTWTFAVAFGPDATPEALEWFRTPTRAFASPEWYCASGAIPYLTPKADDPNADYLKLVDSAIEGPERFDAKREKIDEYGWRHFGDIYGDHEAVYGTGPQPLVSHYNNQYDPVAGFAYQFMRSGRFDWLRHMEELAQHVIDIDIYHTTQDKSAYNGGLFWHTYHYADADTGTHRSYPRSLLQMKGMPGLDPNSPKAQRSKHLYARGGGPADEHNYTTGLMLHYFLTGSEQSREAALGLARWVIDMDDGRKTVFRFLSRADTGYASQSRDASYHGPGRGSGNSLAALIDGHRLSGDPAFLAKAEQLVRRCIHPLDDIAGRNLLDVENRWFYTIFLYSLGKYLDHKAGRGELDSMYAYGRASLLHYARWMAEHEVPTLSRPEVLEYPNETWAAQDVRKSEVFKFAAKHATGAEKAKFLERSEFFFRDSVSRLMGFETRTLARPVVLLLTFGLMQAHFQKHPEESAPEPKVEVRDFGRPEVFVPQKVIAKKRAKLLAVAGAAFGALSAVGLVAWLLLR